ncbi:MAG: UDP-2,3-diacylglucosamine diphosphatase [Dysgonamonadaceae bacterium]|jgi:UDP-2,3-diacylglucosamine hydrolase|nr:UDP-2,3-diacylglucosamine diphosphatase [Dysgonamonadaceae bacterium]
MKMKTSPKIYFASDVHLGSTVFESPRETEKRFVRWLDAIKEDAGALYLLGDIFDFWFEYKKVVPRGFVRFLGKIAEMHDKGVEVHFFTGNHDIWIFDYLPQETGVILHKEPLLTEIAGKQFYLAHGDGLGDDSRLFQLIRSIFHNRTCQRLFACFPSRLGIGFAHKWARHNRGKDLKHPAPYFGEDKERLVLYAKKYLLEHPGVDYFIFGHRHILLDLMLPPKTQMMIIGDWIHYFSYAVFDGNKLSLCRWNELSSPH